MFSAPAFLASNQIFPKVFRSVIFKLKSSITSYTIFFSNKHNTGRIQNMPKELHDPKQLYSDRTGLFKQKITFIKRIDIPLGIFKLASVAAALVFLYLSLTARAVPYLYIFASLVFIIFITSIIHEKALSRRKFFQQMLIINEAESLSLDRPFLDVDDGGEFADPSHCYTSDLDIFGRHSVFHFINRAYTIWGNQTLGTWLRKMEKIETILERQRSIAELKDLIDFRQRTLAFGKSIQFKPKDQEIIQELIQLPPLLGGGKAFTFMIKIIPIFTIAAFVAIFVPAAGISWQVPSLLFALQFFVNIATFRRVNTLYRFTEKSAKILKPTARIIHEIIQQDFSTEYLRELQSSLFHKSRAASYYIFHLSTLVEWLNLRLSAIHFFVNNMVFWDLNLAAKIEKWKVDAGDNVDRWFATVGEMEALNSLGNLMFNHPSWTVPVIGTQQFHLTAKGMGHPLLPQKERIDNDLNIQGLGNVNIITGPNMAGKSTFLRTIGANLVLAGIGAPVCAEEFSFAPCRICTSMKISDSLDQGLSLFYAELQRIKMILDSVACKNQAPVFFIIDEMLKGTNTMDRQQGAIALVKQLLRQKTSGLLATHDLALAELKNDYPLQIQNFHFDGYVQEDQLVFDYRLKNGACNSFNALILMKKIGIEV